MSTETAAQDKAPTRDQLERIRELSAVVLGDPDLLFHHAGYPENTWAASAYLGALHKVRNKASPLPGTEWDIHKQILQIRNRTTNPTAASAAIEEENPVAPPEPDTKHCPRCDTTKPRAEFGRNRSANDGLQSECKTCRRERYAKAKQSAVPTAQGKGPAHPPHTARAEPDPPLSPEPDGWAVFTDPRLSTLHKLQELIDDHLGSIPSLEETAQFATAVGTAFHPKGSTDE